MKQLFTFILLLSGFVGWSQVIPSSGAGTLAEPYQIESLDHLRWIAEGDGGTTTDDVRWSAHYILMADLDLTGINWTAIGTSVTPFTGSFNGNHHTINKLFINRELGYQGFFGYIKGDMTVNTDCFVKDLTLTNANISTGSAAIKYKYFGILAGSAEDVIITNTHTQGTIILNLLLLDPTAENPAGVPEISHHFLHSSAGGLIGKFRATANGPLTAGESIVKDCTSNVTISNGENNIGGMFGEIASWYNKISVIKNCTSSGNVSGYSKVGGFAGNASDVKFDECNSDVNAYSSDFIDFNNTYYEGSQLGGFIGYASFEVTATRCIVSGNVTGFNKTGGFVGETSGMSAPPVKIEKCIVAGVTEGTSIVGGFIGHVDDCYMDQCYTISKVTGVSDVNAFAGIVETGASYTSCYYDSETAGQATDGTNGVVAGLTTAEFGLEANLVGFDFSSDWEIRMDATIDSNPRPYFRDTPTAIGDETVVNELIVAPNPTSGLLKISGVALNSSVKVYNIAGSLVYSVEKYQPEMLIDLCEQESGIYLVLINNKSFKVIKR